MYVCRYYTKRSARLGRQVVRLVFNRADGRLRWANCRQCVAGECRPWCSHILMGFHYLGDIKEGRAISGACTDGRRSWGPNTLDVGTTCLFVYMHNHVHYARTQQVDSRYHRTTLEFTILSGQAPLALMPGLSQVPEDLKKPKMSEFLANYETDNSSPNYMNDPDDLIVQQNFGLEVKCKWTRKRRRDDINLLEKRKRFHAQCKLDRDLLNEHCKY